MIKLALALSLLLGACSADRLLDARVMRTFPRDGIVQVWIPDHEDVYTVNVEDFAGGTVPQSALTCPSLVDLRRMDPSLRYYFAPETHGLYGVNVWTMKGCEGLNEFADHIDGDDRVWPMPPLDKDRGFAEMRETLGIDCFDACDAETNNFPTD